MSSVALEAVTMLAVTVGLLAGGLALTIYVHEYGHYLAFRWVVGVPASDCRIVFAPLEMNYVALRDEDGWIDPFAEPNRHDRTLERYDPTVVDGTIVTAAGPVAHAVAIVSIALLVDAAGVRPSPPDSSAALSASSATTSGTTRATSWPARGYSGIFRRSGPTRGCSVSPSSRSCSARTSWPFWRSCERATASRESNAGSSGQLPPAPP